MSACTTDRLAASVPSSIFAARIQNALDAFNLRTLQRPSKARDADFSPFARMVSSLQQLQQADPARYQRVTQQIAVKLRGVAQNAQSQSNVATSYQLYELANDFSACSQKCYLPSVHHLMIASRPSHGAGHAHTARSKSAIYDPFHPLSIILNELSGQGARVAA